jgi:hypothetical protein
MRVKVPTEHAEQVTFVNWFRDAHPECIIFAIPNGELRHIKVAERLKLEGVTSGVPDLCCMFKDGVTIWIEMKKIKGSRISPEQREFHTKMKLLGHTVKICKGYKDARDFIELSYN